ncbi:MAG: MgtC/SapB family protein [Gemmataceae bacterium]
MIATLDHVADLPDWGQLGIVSARLLLAGVLGGCLGFERERLGKVAGLRTHMLVSMGSALFVLSALESGMQIGDLSRVIQGIATGLGFIGAGVILKLREQEEIRGVTTAANIWITAAIGLAVGIGQLWPAVCATLLAIIVLTVLYQFEKLINAHAASDRLPPREPPGGSN